MDLEVQTRRATVRGLTGWISFAEKLADMVVDSATSNTMLVDAAGVALDSLGSRDVLNGV